MKCLHLQRQGCPRANILDCDTIDPTVAVQCCELPCEMSSISWGKLHASIAIAIAINTGTQLPHTPTPRPTPTPTHTHPHWVSIKTDWDTYDSISVHPSAPHTPTYTHTHHASTPPTLPDAGISIVRSHRKYQAMSVPNSALGADTQTDTQGDRQLCG